MRRYSQIVSCALVILLFVSCEKGGEPFPFQPNEPDTWNLGTLSDEDRMTGQVAMVTSETFTEYEGKIKQSVCCYDSLGRCLDLYYRDLNHCEHIHFDYDTLGRRVEECIYLDTAGVSYDSLTALYTRTTYRYSQNGKRCKAVIESPKGKKYRFRMRYGEERADGSRLLTDYIFPDGSRCSYKYDTAGRLACETFPNGTYVRYTYDSEGNLRSSATPSENNILQFENTVWYVPALVLQRDEQGRVLERQCDQVLETYVYDEYDNWVRRTTVAYQTGATTLEARSIEYY